MKYHRHEKTIGDRFRALIAYDPMAAFRHKKRADGGSVRRAGETYNTQLSPLEEMAYRQWVKDNNVPTNPDATVPQDYDMRGFYQGLQQQNPKAQSAIDPNDSRMHYPDYWKTPIHQTFSNESQWAPANAPQWTDDDKLVQPNGRVVFDDRNQPSDAEKLLTVQAKKRGGRVNLAAHIDEQAKQVDHNPSNPQKEAGNYKKGHIKFHGLDISIENPRGSWRSGGPDGKKWKARLPAHYGYLRKTEGADGDHVDVYLGPHLKAPNVFIIDQHNLHAGKSFDEHKVCLGFGSKKQATEAYYRAFSDGRGRDRVGHVETMTLDGFRSWLKDGDTTKPVKSHLRHFASGGAVDDRPHMADGGIPSFDQTQSVDAEPPPFEATQPVAPDMGGARAALHGAEQGATFGFSDELSGLNAAGPSAVGHIPMVGGIARPAIGAARLAKEAVMGGDQSATQEYEKARDEERAQDELAKSQHPYLHMAGELAGSIPAMAVLPGGEIAQGASLATKAVKGAQLGAEYGGLSGLGHGKDIGDRALQSAEGIVSGIVGGAAAPLVGAAGSKAVDSVASPAISAFRGAMNPEAEASRRLAAALQKDQELISSGKADGMSPADWIAAKHAGEPVTLADLGSSNTQALLRSSANTSPEGRAVLEKAFNDRFMGQTERVSDTVRNLPTQQLPQNHAMINGKPYNINPDGTLGTPITQVGANAGKTGDQLVAEYDAARVPAYKKSYQEGDKPIMTPAMERLMGSDTFVGAMKRAISTGKDRDIEMGLGGFNPMVSVTPDGRIVFNKGAQGAPTYPNLQYWDQVKRELDSVANQAKRSGDTSSSAAGLSKILRGELDQQVPSYANARGIAADYFGEKNALEAGQKLAGKKVDPTQISAVMKKMKPDEQELFREGYASDWANRVISNISDTRDITKAMFNSPNERARALAVFGPAGMEKMQARMSLETIMDGARKAMGNSTTARQLIEAGLAGGTLEGYLSGWDPTKMAEGAAGAAGARKFLGSEMASGARKLVGKVDSKTARLVADLLTSDDPNRLAQGMRMAQKNQRISDGLKNIANRVALAGQQQVAPSRVQSAFSALQGPMSVGAGNEQQ